VKLGLLIVSGDPAWVRRLSAAAGAQGLAVSCVSDPRALASPGAASGVAVVDWAAGGAATRARHWAQAVRRQLPGYALAFAVASSDLVADAMAQALTTGVDAFVDKHGSPVVLGSQLRSLCRRAAATAQAHGLLSTRGDLRFDPERGRVWLKGRAAWRPGPELSAKEAALLRIFLEQPGRMHDRPGLLEAVWGVRCAQVNSEALDKQVASLRRKLGKAGRDLLTVHGRGYCWR